MRDATTSEAVSEGEVREELDRLLQSALLSQSDRLGRFLRFAIEKTLAGKPDALKEYVIGTEVYDRKPPYHPSQDSIVRTEARRLRAKLKEYYESDGKQNPVFIYFRPGTYVPLFRRNEVSSDLSSNGSSADSELLTKGLGVSMAVLPFVDLSRRPLSTLCAQGVTDEITHCLMHTDGIRVIASAALPQSLEGPHDISLLSQRLGLTNVIEGTVREDYNRLRITARVLGADGFQLSSHRFETEANVESLAQIQEQIATALVSRARSEQSLVRRRKATPGSLTFAVYPLVMHAETLLDEGSGTDIPAALLKFQEASELVPSYGRSYCGISYCNTELALRGVTPSSAFVSLAKEAAFRAIDLDPEMIESYSCLGAAQALEWDWESAERSFLHGISLGTHVSSSRRYAIFLAVRGRYDEAVHHLEAAQRIDPFSNRQKVTRLKFLHIARRFEEGLRQLSEPFIYGPLPVEATFILALMSAHLGKREQAVRLIDSIRPALSGQLPMFAAIAEVLALSGESDQAVRMVESFKLLSSTVPISRSRQALLALALGDRERALSLLESAVEGREAELVWIGVDPRLDPLRDVPLFKDLAHKILHDAP